MSVPEEPGNAPTVTAGLSWRGLAIRAATAIAVIFVLLMVAFMFFDPFLLVFVVVFAVLAWWMRGGSKASVIVAGALGVVFIVMNIPFLSTSLRAPASPSDFIPSVFLLLAAFTLVFSAFMASRDELREGARTAVTVAIALALIAGVVSIASRFTYESSEPKQGDVTLTTVDTEFDPDTLAADAGTVAVFVTNEDPTLHTFTIEELDVSLVIPQNSSARIEFEAESGEYEFICVPHEQAGMTGTLQVR